MLTEKEKEWIENNAHIPTAEVEKDIADTLAEIEVMKVEADHLEATPMTMPTARWDHMRGRARRTSIIERQEFVAKLEKLLALREKNNMLPL